MVADLHRVVEQVVVELVDGITYICFIFPVNADGAREGLQFQWSEEDLESDGVYVELGDQSVGGFNCVQAVQLHGQRLTVNLKPGSRIPYLAVNLDCSSMAPSALQTAVAALETALRR